MPFLSEYTPCHKFIDHLSQNGGIWELKHGESTDWTHPTSEANVRMQVKAGGDGRFNLRFKFLRQYCGYAAVFYQTWPHDDEKELHVTGGGGRMECLKDGRAVWTVGVDKFRGTVTEEYPGGPLRAELAPARNFLKPDHVIFEVPNGDSPRSALGYYAFHYPDAHKSQVRVAERAAVHQEQASDARNWLMLLPRDIMAMKSSWANPSLTSPFDTDEKANISERLMANGLHPSQLQCARATAAAGAARGGVGSPLQQQPQQQQQPPLAKHAPLLEPAQDRHASPVLFNWTEIRSSPNAEPGTPFALPTPLLSPASLPATPALAGKMGELPPEFY